MNDAADEPSKPTSAEPDFRVISDEDLRSILEQHEKWVAAKDKTGLDSLRADLSQADLREQDGILRVAQLQGAFLLSAQLEKANLVRAQLQEATLAKAHLEAADLASAQLQEADLSFALLQGARLGNAQLQGSLLIGAQLQGAVLHRAHFQGANLIGANFERLAIEEDGEPAQERSADLTDANFRDADQSNAQLSTVTGLRAGMLAGAVLTNAKLPEDVARFDQLKHVEETSRNATTVFFGLLAASLYCWLTIATTTDVALITGTASSPLLIINTNIALSGLLLSCTADPACRVLLLSPVPAAALE